MTEDEKIEFLKILVGSVGFDEEKLLKAYLRIAASIILKRLYPFNKGEDKELPGCYAVKQCEIASYLYNKRGAEGETSHDENGIKRTYESGDVPPSMLKDIVPFAEVL